MLDLDWEVLVDVARTIGLRKAESGGAIGGKSNGEMIVNHFHFDESSRNSAVTYSPDHRLLNRLFVSDWNPRDVRLRGFIHSHPGLVSMPSYGDEVYAARILEAIEDCPCLWLPIVSTIPDTGTFGFTPWVVYRAHRGVSVVPGRVRIIRAPAKSPVMIGEVNLREATEVDVPLERIVVGEGPVRRPTKTVASGGAIEPAPTDIAPGMAKEPGESAAREMPSWAQETARTFKVCRTFDRVQNAYDLELMAGSRIVAVGTGGASQWLEEMARAGAGQFVLVDHDTVSETNLATQQAYRKDIGRPKVDCIAERIRDINPTARAIAIQKSLDDLDDEEVRRLACDDIDGYRTRMTIVCGLTDNFFAQARVNRIALQLGLPSLNGQVYREGRGAEITFTYPGVTPACNRCILSSRYKYFLEQEGQNDVTSHGTPIWATSRLNSLKGFIALALLHYGTDHPRWGNMLSRIGKRNLVQIRMDPDIALTVPIRKFDEVFEKADRERLFFDEVIWLPQDPECPEHGYSYHCPDCGGTGDLRDRKGQIANTRDFRSDGHKEVLPQKAFDANAQRAIEAYKQTGGKHETLHGRE